MNNRFDGKFGIYNVYNECIFPTGRGVAMTLRRVKSGQACEFWGCGVDFLGGVDFLDGDDFFGGRRAPRKWPKR